MKTSYLLGETCWVHNGGDCNPLIPATVVHTFALPGWGIKEHYVLEIPTPIEPLLVVRDALSMSEDASGPVGLFRQ